MAHYALLVVPLPKYSMTAAATYIAAPSTRTIWKPKATATAAATTEPSTATSHSDPRAWARHLAARALPCAVHGNGNAYEQAQGQRESQHGYDAHCQVGLEQSAAYNRYSSAWATRKRPVLSAQ